MGWRRRALAGSVVAVVTTSALTAAQMSWRSTLLYWDLDLRSGVGSIGAQTELAFLPDGRTLVTASEDQRIRHWDTASTRMTRTVALSPGSMRPGSVYVGNPAALSPAGRVLVTLYPNRNADGMKVWNTETGVLRWSAVWGGGTVAFSPDGRTLAATALPTKPGESRSTVTLWDVATGKARTSALSVPAVVRAIAFLRDTRYVVTAGETAGKKQGGGLAAGGGDVRIWDATTGKLVRALPAFGSGASAVALSPDGRTLAVGSSRDAATLWNLANGKRLRVLQAKGTGRHGGEVVGKAVVHALAFSPDGKLLAGAGGRAVHIWNGSNGDYHHSLKLSIPRRTVGDPDAGRVIFSPDGGLLAASAQRLRAVTVWHIR